MKRGREAGYCTRFVLKGTHLHQTIIIQILNRKKHTILTSYVELYSQNFVILQSPCTFSDHRYIKSKMQKQAHMFWRNSPFNIYYHKCVTTEMWGRALSRVAICTRVLSVCYWYVFTSSLLQKHKCKHAYTCNLQQLTNFFSSHLFAWRAKQGIKVYGWTLAHTRRDTCAHIYTKRVR